MTTSTSDRTEAMRSRYVVILVFLIFFVISLLTNVQGPLIPDIKTSFGLSDSLVANLPLAFFSAYGVMSIPAGVLVDRYDAKPVLLGSFVLALIGCASFVLHPTYGTVLFSLFTIGVGMAMLQVVINPLLRISGGEEHYAFNGVLAQLIFGLASLGSPFLFSYLAKDLSREGGPSNFVTRTLGGMVPTDKPWIALYVIFTVVSLAMVVVLAFSRIPKVELQEEEKAGTRDSYLELAKNPMVWLFFAGIFCYVGTEQGVANWMSEFLRVYHGLDPQVEGARAVAYFWGLMSAGCALGLVLLKLWDSRRLLIGFGVAAAITLAAALYGPRTVSLWAFPILGFWASIMWAVIFSLALNSLSRHHGSFAGILCTGILGGALVPKLIGIISTHTGLRIGMLAIFGTLAYIISIGFWARPLITNATIQRES